MKRVKGGKGRGSWKDEIDKIMIDIQTNYTQLNPEDQVLTKSQLKRRRQKNKNSKNNNNKSNNHQVNTTVKNVLYQEDNKNKNNNDTTQESNEQMNEEEPCWAEDGRIPEFDEIRGKYDIFVDKDRRDKLRTLAYDWENDPEALTAVRIYEEDWHHHEAILINLLHQSLLGVRHQQACFPDNQRSPLLTNVLQAIDQTQLSQTRSKTLAAMLHFMRATSLPKEQSIAIKFYWRKFEEMNNWEEVKKVLISLQSEPTSYLYRLPPDFKRYYISTYLRPCESMRDPSAFPVIDTFTVLRQHAYNNYRIKQKLDAQ